ncbi:MAG: Rne/Rng family ribonuclease [Blastocatellales bacterium]|nr:Rne/Rng family ribonuclease [Blastocatellales bacterium]
MAKELIVSVNGREKKIAIVEDDAVTEFYVERGDENQGIVGNIYKGRVMKVLPGMQSAFVDIGLERDAFLYVSDFIEEEDEDGAFEDRKEPARPQRPERFERAEQRPERAERPERSRPSRIPLPEPVEVGDEGDESDEDELHIAALHHIEEITEEPVIEPAEDDEIIEAEPPAAEPDPRRQRRQRRLRYSEPEPAAVEAEETARESEAEPQAEAEAAEPEESATGKRRRRPRRKRGAEAAEPVEAPESAEETAAIETVDNGYEPVSLAFREPLERITDDYEGLEGEMLKDAMVQEKITGRIHADEILTSVLEVEPTPEVTVGSLHASIEEDSEFERISDDEPAGSEASLTVVEVVEASSATAADLAPDAPEVSGVEPGEQVAGDAEQAESTDAPGQETEAGTAAEAADSSASEVEPGGEGQEDEPPLEDASAEVRQRPVKEEMATRRGGRGRRRFQRTPMTDATGGEEAESEYSEAVREPAAPPAPPAPPAYARPAERFHRPVISDLLREGQEILVQIAKEPIGQKGARITSHIAMPGRYIVYMPTVEHIGVSRKIGTDEERQRLRRTLHQLRAETGAPGGFIVRTAANGCSIEELRDDMQYLIRTWTDIRRRAERAKSPAIIHRDLDLVQRILRDHLSSDFNAIRVDNEFEYERIVDFVNRFAPKLVHRVKLYTKDTPILDEYGVQPEIDKAVKPRVWLKSGGYIVINQTEALVAIDVNTGKFVGKSNRLEDTIVKTNLEAAKEIVRQIRLRDLGGIIVLDFIDMEERRNRMKVMQALEQELRNDRSPSKILQFNDFGLVAVTRKRVKQSLERTLCTPCAYCTGGGMVKSPQTMCYEILAEARRVSKEVDSHNEVILRVSSEVAKALRSTERDVFSEIETYLGGVVTIKSDPAVHQEQFDIALV